MSDYIRASNFTSSFASHVHKKVIDTIAQSNDKYKLRADVRKGFKIFNVGDYVMIRIRLERFPPETLKTLHACSAGPFQILKKLNNNTYVFDVSQDFGISFTFNIEDLVDYKGPDFNLSLIHI